MTDSKCFNFCVGRPWPKKLADNSDGTSLCIYSFAGQVQYGTMGDAHDFLAYVNKQTGEKNFIYKLVPVSESSADGSDVTK